LPSHDFCSSDHSQTMCEIGPRIDRRCSKVGRPERTTPVTIERRGCDYQSLEVGVEDHGQVDLIAVTRTILAIENAARKTNVSYGSRGNKPGLVICLPDNSAAHSIMTSCHGLLHLISVIDHHYLLIRHRSANNQGILSACNRSYSLHRSTVANVSALISPKYPRY
jgi:hypothetical protein